jgi:glycosyltransferase involved in cell wall biosynthesis
MTSNNLKRSSKEIWAGGMTTNKDAPYYAPTTSPDEPDFPNVLHSFGDRFGYTGTGTTAYQLAHGAAALGCRLFLASPSYDRIPPSVSKTFSTVSLLGHRIPFKLIGARWGRKIHDWRTAALIERYGDSIDIVHCWSGTALNTLKAARQKKVLSFLHRSNTHTAYAYATAEAEHKRLGISMPSSYFYSFHPERLKIEETEYDLADRILAPSEFVAQTFLDKGFPAEKLVTIQYGYSPEHFSLPAKDSPTDTGHVFTAAFVGRGEPRKGLHLALQAWVESGLCLRGRLLLAGDMHFLPEYRKKIQHWLSHPSVTELGVVADVAAVLRNTDVLILPTLEEGSAKVTYEARACGCVLAVSNHSGAPCTHMKNSLVHDAGDVATLQEHLLMLEQDPVLFNRLKTESIAGIDRLTWAYAAGLLVSAYKKALKDTGRSLVA